MRQLKFTDIPTLTREEAEVWHQALHNELNISRKANADEERARLVKEIDTLTAQLNKANDFNLNVTLIHDICHDMDNRWNLNVPTNPMEHSFKGALEMIHICVHKYLGIESDAL